MDANTSNGSVCLFVVTFIGGSCVLVLLYGRALSAAFGER